MMKSLDIINTSSHRMTIEAHQIATFRPQQPLSMPGQSATKSDRISSGDKGSSAKDKKGGRKDRKGKKGKKEKEDANLRPWRCLRYVEELGKICDTDNADPAVPCGGQGCNQMKDDMFSMWLPVSS
jgi:hypothetical protein